MTVLSLVAYFFITNEYSVLSLSLCASANWLFVLVRIGYLLMNQVVFWFNTISFWLQPAPWGAGMTTSESTSGQPSRTRAALYSQCTMRTWRRYMSFLIITETKVIVYKNHTLCHQATNWPGFVSQQYILWHLIKVSVLVDKPFTSTMRFGPEQYEGPYRMASERFTNILSTWFTREIKFFVFLSIS